MIKKYICTKILILTSYLKIIYERNCLAPIVSNKIEVYMV